MTKREHILVIILCAVTIWAARYAQSSHFGLYEDDYNRIPHTLSMTFGELTSQIAVSFQGLTEHGKVLHAPLSYILIFLGGKLNGLQGVYWIGFAVCVLNAWLFYYLLRRLGSHIFALVGVLAYCLFSADTTQALLTVALGDQPSLTFLLLAFHSYLSNRKVLAYVLAGLILLTYETPFPVFLAAPLLVSFLPQDARSGASLHWASWKEWLRHIVVLAGMILLVVILRSLVGESRVSGLNLQTILRTPLVQMALGMFTSLRLFIWSRPRQALSHLDPKMGKLVGAMFAVFLTVILIYVTEKWSKLLLKIFPQKTGLNFKHEAQRLLAGLVLLLLAYPLTFTINATATDGRDTRVHLAAVIGVAWLVAWGATLLFSLAGMYGRKFSGILRLVIAVGLAAFFAIQVGYGILIQRDYVTSWQYQRQFWNQLLPLITDARDGDIILVEPSVMRSTPQIGVITWNTPTVLEQIYNYPADWSFPPRVYRLEPGWENNLISPSGLVQLSNSTSFISESVFTEVDSNKVIFIENQDGRLVRHTAPLLINGVEYPVKQPVKGSEPTFDPGDLYKLMILNP
jgi:hypothetical protein